MFSTYLGGATGADNDEKMAIDSAGNVLIVGSTESYDFPIANAIQSTYGGGAKDGFLTKLTPDGQILLFSTFLGGSLIDG